MQCRLLLALFIILPAARAALADQVEFDRDIAPLLSRRCLPCHRGEEAEANLDLSQHASLLTGGESGAAVRPGSASDSLIWQRVSADEMPEDKPLTDREKALLRRWIVQGAKWGKGPIDPMRLSTDSRAGYDWWAFQDLRQSDLPRVSNTHWVRNPIDVFILARLEAAGLQPSPPAASSQLLRRVCYDLTGLPPSVEQREQSEANLSDWYPRTVDALLGSPLYGQHWARHWLDVVRFGESHGFEYNQPRNNAWHYRNWVIGAFNQDMPYDHFVRWQIAGDALHPDQHAALAATGFLVAGPHNTTKPSNDQMRMTMRHDELEDIVGTIGQTFLGMTINCARCHDHKFDPVTQREYYQLVAAVAGIDHGTRDIPGPQADAARKAKLELTGLNKSRNQLGEELTRLEEAARSRLELSADGECTGEPARRKLSEAELRNALTTEQRGRLDELRGSLAAIDAKRNRLELIKAEQIYTAISKAPPKVNRLRRGDVTAPAESVVPAGLQAINSDFSDFGLSETSSDQQRRLRLADWLTMQNNPVLARVIVNRVWHYHFGQGLVRTPSDFGFNGDRPSHPELLDYLAVQLIRSDWNLKPLHRMIVTSATYRQRSLLRPKASQIDAGNRLLWRVNPRRLTAEEIRDSILMASGALDLRLGGAGYRDMKEYKYRGSHFYDPIEPTGAESLRRTVYRFTPRGAKRTILDTFDCPDPSAKAPKRASTITPLQALALLNHHFVLDMAEICAQRVNDPGITVHQQVDVLFQAVYGRDAEARELDEASAFVRENTLADLCRVLFNSNEFLHVR